MGLFNFLGNAPCLCIGQSYCCSVKAYYLTQSFQKHYSPDLVLLQIKFNLRFDLAFFKPRSFMFPYFILPCFSAIITLHSVFLLSEILTQFINVRSYTSDNLKICHLEISLGINSKIYLCKKFLAFKERRKKYFF